jgi:phage tail-like protein
MPEATSQTAQRLLTYLPAIYRDDPFVGRYLWAFEQLLVDIERRIDGVARYFDPLQTPPEFLSWLSSWAAFTLRSDLDVEQQRKLLAKIVSLYRRRGTKDNLQLLLTTFTIGAPKVEEYTDAASVHRFKVTLNLPSNAAVVQRQRAIAQALIDLEKPAHTICDLFLEFNTMQIGVTSHVGVDTLLGTIPTPQGAARLAAQPHREQQTKLEPQAKLAAVPKMPTAPPSKTRASAVAPMHKSTRKPRVPGKAPPNARSRPAELQATRPHAKARPRPKSGSRHKPRTPRR